MPHHVISLHNLPGVGTFPDLVEDTDIEKTHEEAGKKVVEDVQDKYVGLTVELAPFQSGVVSLSKDIRVHVQIQLH